MPNKKIKTSTYHQQNKGRGRNSGLARVERGVTRASDSFKSWGKEKEGGTAKKMVPTGDSKGRSQADQRETGPWG